MEFFCARTFRGNATSGNELDIPLHEVFKSDKYRGVGVFFLGFSTINSRGIMVNEYTRYVRPMIRGNWRKDTKISRARSTLFRSKNGEELWKSPVSN